MRGPLGIALLIAAAVLVGFQNYVFFFANSNAGGVEDEDEPGFERAEDERAEEPLAAVSSAEIAAWISLQDDPPRSPFLTRAEALAMGDEARSLEHRLRGVLWGATRRVAWIDGRPHSENDWVGEHQIERIEPGAVWLRRGDELVELALGRDQTVIEEETLNGVE